MPVFPQTKWDRLKRRLQRDGLCLRPPCQPTGSIPTCPRKPSPMRQREQTWIIANPTSGMGEKERKNYNKSLDGNFCLMTKGKRMQQSKGLTEFSDQPTWTLGWESCISYGSELRIPGPPVGRVARVRVCQWIIPCGLGATSDNTRLLRLVNESKLLHLPIYRLHDNSCCSEKGYYIKVTLIRCTWPTEVYLTCNMLPSEWPVIKSYSNALLSEIYSHATRARCPTIVDSTKLTNWPLTRAAIVTRPRVPAG